MLDTQEVVGSSPIPPISLSILLFILGMISNIINLKNVPAYPQQVIKGLIIVFAVLLQGIQRRSETTKTP
jgi:ribose transport system permease protein